jgi:uncharacterized RDD family membrane protein YckC
MAERNTQRFRTQNVEWQARLQGLPLASFGARAVAFLIDGLIVAGLVAIASAIPKIAFGTSATAFSLSFELGGLGGFAAMVLYFGVATYLGKGVTIGKRVTGIQVVSLVHDHLSLWHCFERALGYAASSLEAGFGFLQYFTHANRQTVHDRIAETIVIVRQVPTTKTKPVKA